MKVLLIILAYNEEKSILKTINKIRKYNAKFDYVVINDGSIDNTKNILIKNDINHISLLKNLGIGGAVQTGYKYALDHNYDIAVQFDGDGQHNIEYVEDLIDPIINKKADMVIGSRFIKSLSNYKSTKIRRIGIHIISFFIKLFTEKKIYDTTSGFRAINKRVILEFANDYPSEYPEPISTTILLKKKFRIKEVPVKMNERSAGISSIRTWKNVYYMVNVILSLIVVNLRRYK